MKKVLFVFLFFLLFPFITLAKTSVDYVTFVRCVDGDTAVFKRGEEELKVRFLAIDTPETVHPTKEVESFGKNASEYTCNKLQNAEEILLEYEESNNIDKYQRILAWIWIDGSLLQKELIDIGYAKVAYIYGEYRYTKSLCLYQSIAKSYSLGLWFDETEDGYCSTIDLTDVTDNIIYGEIENISSDDLDKLNKLEETINKLDKLTDKWTKYSSENEDKIITIYTYLILGIAAITVFIKNIKK